MVRGLIAICAAMSMVFWAGPASAQVADSDVQCLALSKFFALNEKDPKGKELATASAFFFLGRIDARLSPEQLRVLITAPGNSVKKIDAGRLMTACAKKFQSSQQSLLNMGTVPADWKRKK